MNQDNPEIKAQLYGGEISDYFKKPEPCKDDDKQLGDIYDAIRKNRLKQIIYKNPDTDNKPGI